MASEQLLCCVCLNTYQQPKSLPCGHSLCRECSIALIHGHTIVCPVCREKSTVPSKGLPTNFALKGLVDDLADNSSLRCSKCTHIYGEDQLYVCVQCDPTAFKVLCASCTLEEHNRHETTKLSTFIDPKRKELSRSASELHSQLQTIVPQMRDCNKKLCTASDNLSEILSLLAVESKSIGEKCATTAPSDCVRRLDLIKALQQNVTEIWSQLEKNQNTNLSTVTAALQTLCSQKYTEPLASQIETVVKNAGLSCCCWKCGKIGCDTISCDFDTLTISIRLSNFPIQHQEQVKAYVVGVLRCEHDPNALAKSLRTKMDSSFGSTWQCFVRSSSAGSPAEGISLKNCAVAELIIGALRVVLFKMNVKKSSHSDETTFVPAAEEAAHVTRARNRRLVVPRRPPPPLPSENRAPPPPPTIPLPRTPPEYEALR